MRATLNCLLVTMVCLAVGWAQAPSAKESLPLSIPFEFANNQVYLKTGINGSEPRWFVLDTGASGCVIDSAVAKELGLKITGERKGTGAGKGTYTISFAKNVTFNLRGLDLPVESSYVIDLSGQPAITGREITGILGYDLFARYTVEIDYEAAILRLHSPGGFHYSGDGEAIPIELEKNTPHIRAKIAVAGQTPQERKLLVDSGSGDAVDDDLLAQSPKRLEIQGGVGLGKEFRTVLGRADSLQIGGFIMQQPFGAAGGVPLVGTEVLRRFNVFFDYAHGRMILEPNSHFHDPFVMDASGLDLRWSRDGFLVHDVGSDSAGKDAGIQPDDMIVAIDHQPASAFTLEQIGKLMTQVGRTVLLTIRRGKDSRDLSIVLRKRL